MQAENQQENKEKDIKSIWGQISKEIADWDQTELDCNPSFARTQKDVINLIDSYWVSKYVQGDQDSSGFKKAFFNIVTNPTEVASKMIDLDTKDIRVIAEEGQDFYPSWLLGKELKIWMKDNKNDDGKTFGQILNEMVFMWPKYGHILVKKTQDDINIVPLQNIINGPKSKSILQSRRVIERHEYTPEELEEKPWDHIEEVIDKYTNSEGKIVIYEMHGPWRESKEYNYFIVPEKGKNDEIMFYDKIDRSDLYRELKWDDIPGRAMGRGQVEKLFENQIVKNQDVGLERAGLRWSSKHIFQTKDQTIAKNLLTDIENGDLVLVNSEITPIAVEERNLAFYRQSDAKWDANAADITFSHEPVSGERSPAGATLGGQVLATKMAGQYYDLKRQELGLFMTGLITDWILPTFKKEKNKEHKVHWLSLLGDDTTAEGLFNTIVSHNTTLRQVEMISKGVWPLGEKLDILKSLEGEKVKKSNLEIPKGFYDDLKYKIRVIIDSEQIDLASRMTTLQTVLQILGSNPTILQDRVTKKVFYRLLDLAGISPIDMGFEEQVPGLVETAQSQMQAQKGGSIAASKPTTMPQTTPTQTQI